MVRPRDETRSEQIRQATIALLAETGYDLLTMDAVAARAGVSKPTIYRRWQSRAELVVDVVRGMAVPFEIPDTGTVAEDLRIAVAHVQHADTFQIGVLGGLISALPRHPDLAALFRERVAAPRQALLRVIFERGIERGEIADDADPDLLAAVLPSMLIFRALLTAAPADPAFADAVLRRILLPLVTRERPDTTRTTHAREGDA